MAKDDKMETITQVAKRTGVSVNTLRDWARNGELSPAERRERRGVLTWHTTVGAVEARLSKPRKVGRPIRLKGA